VYISNENATAVDVYFDDITMTYTIPCGKFSTCGQCKLKALAIVTTSWKLAAVGGQFCKVGSTNTESSMTHLQQVLAEVTLASIKIDLEICD